MNESNTAIGIVTIGISALGKCQRKTRIMSTTVMTTSLIVCFTLPMVSWINSDGRRSGRSSRLPAARALSL